MSGFLAFMDRYRDEAACIAALAELRWPDGFLCAGCAGRTAYQLASRPRVFECAGCGQQHSVTAGTVFHRTRTPLRKWFAAAWLIGQDKRGVSALFLARELAEANHAALGYVPRAGGARFRLSLRGGE